MADMHDPLSTHAPPRVARDDVAARLRSAEATLEGLRRGLRDGLPMMSERGIASALGDIRAALRQMEDA